MIKKVNISQIKENKNNPRVIKGYKFEKLVKSIKDFPEMMQLRPIIVNDKNIILGGNMRYKASVEAGLKEIYIVEAKDLTQKQQEEFIIKDNSSFGEWDWDILANEWNVQDLSDWGLDIPFDTDEKEIINEKPKNDNYEEVVIVVAKNLNDLDKISNLYNLECVQINEDVKLQINKEKKMYVFKK